MAQWFRAVPSGFTPVESWVPGSGLREEFRLSGDQATPLGVSDRLRKVSKRLRNGNRRCRPRRADFVDRGHFPAFVTPGRTFDNAGITARASSPLPKPCAAAHAPCHPPPRRDAASALPLFAPTTAGRVASAGRPGFVARFGSANGLRPAAGRTRVPTAFGGPIGAL
ncbi:hypothetical protein Rrhod_0499 [Rhodococcus rhodnii LMG 5362]|uniref:Uncharacterized protein n=1 Tax=Rhodococcus rhodnii LMG 5362 TaxID=1273125 RepID=R7WVH9_9NOCA|nr:hypothetical protein Rrhod_0499 [Rhodococcus rhodnii LMG 5362]